MKTDYGVLMTLKSDVEKGIGTYVDSGVLADMVMDLEVLRSVEQIPETSSKQLDRMLDALIRLDRRIDALEKADREGVG